MKHAPAALQPRTAPRSKRQAFGRARPSAWKCSKSERIVVGSRIGTGVCACARGSWVAKSLGTSTVRAAAVGTSSSVRTRERSAVRRMAPDHTGGVEVLFFETPAEWRAWLEEHATETKVLGGTHAP